MGLEILLTRLLWISGSVVVLSTSFIAIYLLYRHYNKTKITDFLILLLFYAFATINALSILIFTERHPVHNDPLVWYGRLITSLSAIITFFTFYLHGVRMKWERQPDVIKYPVYLLFVIDGIVILFKIATYSFFIRELVNVEIYVSNVVRVIIGLVPLYAYLSVEPVEKGKAIFRTRIAYILLSLGFIAIGGLNLLIKVLSDLGIFKLSELDLLVRSQGLVAIFSILIFPFLFLVSIFYPQSILISKAQLLRAHDLYKRFEKKTDLDDSNLHWKYDELIRYVQNLPSDIFEDPAK